MTARYELMERKRAAFPVVMMARLLEVARSGFYKWLKTRRAVGPGRPMVKGVRARRRAWLAKLVLQAHRAAKGRYGARRIHAVLLRLGEEVSLGLVGKIMRELGLKGAQPHASKRTTIPAKDAASRPDLVRRRFTPPVPGTFLVSDITYLRTSEGWLYLATVIDLTTRMVVGWQLADHMRTSLVIDALEMACQSGRVAGNAVGHSDKGAQYTSRAYAEAAARMDIRLSVGRTGSCHDNAVAEAWFSVMKNEMFHRLGKVSKARARALVAEYIEIDYNRHRLHSTLGYRTPTEAMAAHFNNKTADNLPLAA